jgi:hypothetical protein
VTLSRLKTTTYAAGLAAALLLAGCGTPAEQPGAQPSAGTAAGGSTASRTTATATGAASVDPVIARIPAAARPETKEGAKAYAAFFLASLNEASRVADATLLEGLFTPECKTCSAMHATVTELAKSKRRYASDTVRLLGVDPIVFNGDRRIMRARFDQVAVDILNGAGAPIDKTVAAPDSAFAISLRFTDGRWIVTKVQTIQS